MIFLNNFNETNFADIARTACVAHALQEHVDKAKLFREPKAFWFFCLLPKFSLLKLSLSLAIPLYKIQFYLAQFLTTIDLFFVFSLIYWCINTDSKI